MFHHLLLDIVLLLLVHILFSLRRPPGATSLRVSFAQNEARISMVHSKEGFIKKIVIGMSLIIFIQLQIGLFTFIIHLKKEPVEKRLVMLVMMILTLFLT